MDALAQWFQILRERGEVLDTPVAYFESIDAAPLRRWRFPHEEFDGARIMERVLVEMGIGPVSPPRIRYAKPPASVPRLAALWRELREPPHAPVPWRRFDRTVPGAPDAPTAYSLFEPEEVDAIARRAAAQGARSNSFLLWALDRAIYDQLAYPSPTHRWAVPVNLRGALGELERMNNVVASISVVVRQGATPADIKGAIRAQLERNAHWGAWDSFRLLGYLGSDAMRRYAAKYYARPAHSWLGTFTNVGPYDVDGGWVCGFAPVMRTHPIGAAAFSIGKHLSLGLQVHPALGVTNVDYLMARWRAVLAGQPLP